MENISWNDNVQNPEVLHRVKEERNILHTIKLDSSHIVKKLPSEPRYSRKDTGMDRSDGKTRKKT
jgi:hypothetical protein